MSNSKIISENVWDYPRPAICQPFSGTLEVYIDDILVARTKRAWRVIETSHPPSYYFHPEDVQDNLLKKNTKTTLCEWKGQASYFDYLSKKNNILDLCWTYQAPVKNFLPIRNYFSFYSSKCNSCFINNEKVISQDGDFYGGWITKNLIGPFKGSKRTLDW